MNRHSRQQRGAILPMMAILIIVLVGIAALALDLGRLFVHRTELQNAADSAALAAAAELDGKAGAQARAKAAAWQLLAQQGPSRGIFFGDFSPQDDIKDEDFIFYSSIGTRDEPEKVEALGDGDSFYVELTVDLADEEGEGVDLYFLPVLGLLPNVDVDKVNEGLSARALAGKQNVECYRPPMFMCVDDPINWSDNIPGNDPLQEGDMIFLKEHGGGNANWTPGNAGFLADLDKTGAQELSEYLATAGRDSCIPSKISSEPGGNTGPFSRGLNTRFDKYKKDFSIPQNPDFEPTEYPPAPNIISYPRDAGINDTNRIGNGNWDRAGYFAQYHSGGPLPGNPNSITRFETYMWELGLDTDGDKLTPFVTHMPVDRGHLPPHSPLAVPCDPDVTGNTPYDPNTCHGEPIAQDEHLDKHFQCLTGDTVCTDLYNAIYRNPSPDYDYTTYYSTIPTDPGTKPDSPTTNPERRVMYVAAIDCSELDDLEGRFQDLELTPETGRFIKLFLTEHVADDTSDFEVFAEYIGLAGDQSPGEQRVVIQLYE